MEGYRLDPFNNGDNVFNVTEALRPLGRMRGTWSHMFDEHEDGSKDHTYTGHIMVETATGVFVLKKDFVKKGIKAYSDDQLEKEVKAWIDQVYILLEGVQYAPYPPQK